ncbi:MAG: amino acid dehydrogenase, partial [Gemmatimonadota bacterium]
TLDDGVKAPVDGRHGIAGHATTVADMITGYGVAQAVRRFYEAEDRSLDGTRVQLEGFGNVGAAAGLYLARSGARIVAISDADHVLIEPDGLDAAAIQDLMLASEDKLLPENDPRLRPRAEDTSFLDTPADIFVCAAVSGSVTDDVLDRLEHAGVSVIASGANQPFREARMGSTKVAQAADKRFSVLPDFLANCGMARAFSYLMEPDAQPTADPIFEAVDHTVGDALAEVLDRSGGKMRGLFAGTLAMAMDRIGA